MLRTFLKRSLFAIEEPFQVLTKHTPEACVKIPPNICSECCALYNNTLVAKDKKCLPVCWHEEQTAKQQENKPKHL